MRASYVVYRRTSDGRLLKVLRMPGWLPVFLAALAFAGAAHLAWRLPDVIRLGGLRQEVRQARIQSAVERLSFLDMHERLAAMRKQVDPVATLNAKLAGLTSLAGVPGEERAMGSPGMMETGSADERRIGRQLTEMARALVEEIAFQESRQRQLAAVMRERALEFAARPSLWPVRGNLNSAYGYRYMGRSRDHHKGVDIGVPVGSPVVAPADGKVTAVGYESGYGLMVVLEHRHGVSTIYAHLKSALVEEGAEVARGERIALTGMSGRTTGSHLHYEVRVAGQAVDPMNYMLD